MKKAQVIITAVAVAFLWVVGACGPKPEPAGGPAAVSKEIAPPSSPKQAWEEDWERTLAAARQEARVAIYASYGAEWRQAFAEIMSRRYGITMEAATLRQEEQAERVMREARAGVNYVDVMFPNTTLFRIYQPAGIVQPLDRMIILPEVSDSKAWWRGTLAWLDPDAKTFLSYEEYVSAPMVINTDLVRPGELRSWSDLLDPKWKGRIVLNDPTGTGAGQTVIAMLGFGIKDWDFVRRLASQEPVLSRDNRLMVEWIARGKYPILLSPHKETVIDFMKAGAPIAFFIPSEGTYLAGASRFVASPRKSPHPNAAKVFINFFLSREGQTLSSKVTGYQSSRTDVPTDHLLPILVRQPGAKYISTLDKEFREKDEELIGRVLEIFQPLKAR